MSTKNLSRKAFIRTAALGGLITVNIPEIDAAAPATKKLSLSKDDIILFQGDSITDAHRKRDDNAANSPSALGSGYPVLAAADLLSRYPGKSLKCYNKGVSGVHPSLAGARLMAEAWLQTVKG